MYIYIYTHTHRAMTRIRSFAGCWHSHKYKDTSTKPVARINIFQCVVRTSAARPYPNPMERSNCKPTSRTTEKYASADGAAVCRAFLADVWQVQSWNGCS